MALETGNYINDLVITNPTSSDPKSAGDDHLRLLKKTLKETLNGFTGAILVTATDTGSATAHILTPTTALIGYTPMLCLLYLPATTNTGALTVNVSGLGAKSIKTMYGADPTAGDIVAGVPMLLMYNGTNFLLLAGAGFMGLTGNQTITGNLTITGSQTVTINQIVTGNQTVSGTSNLATVNISGNATAPTPTVGDNDTSIATTAFVTTAVANEATLRANADALLAPLASPVLTGNPTAPTPASGDNDTSIATTEFVRREFSPITSPVFTGNPTSPTPSLGDNDTSIATTEFVCREFAPLASPVLTGTPTSTTAANGTNTTQIATCAFVMAQAFNVALPAQSGNAGKFVTTDGINASWAAIVNASTSTSGLLTSTDWNIFNNKLSATWVIKNTTYIAVSKDQILADTSSTAFTITLPAASVNDYVAITDYKGTFATNNLTINSNGLNLMGSVQTLILNVNYRNVTLVYSGATQGWVIVL